MKTFYLVQDRQSYDLLFQPKDGHSKLPEVTMKNLPLAELEKYAYRDSDEAERFVNRHPERPGFQVRQVQMKVTL